MTADLELPRNIRCYDGAYDSDTKRVIEAQEAAMELIRKSEPSAHVTYFPVEGEWVVHVFGRLLSEYKSTKGAALTDALARLEKRSS